MNNVTLIERGVLLSDSYKCVICGEDLDYFNIAYLGPIDPEDKSCSPDMRFICICWNCVDRLEKILGGLR